MKKVYAKPIVCVEHFEMSQHIASCDFNVRGMNSVEDCYAVGKDSEFNGERLFMSGNGECHVDTEEFCTYNAMNLLTFTS